MHNRKEKTRTHMRVFHVQSLEEVPEVKRTDADGHDSNRYTEGNPSLGIPATVVGAEEMNNIQEEIVNVVLDAGLTLDGSDEDQLLEALKIIIARGGDQSSQTITDNAPATVITNLVFDKANIKSARVYYDIFRRNDTQSASEVGEMYVFHDTEADIWRLELDSKGDDAEVQFDVTAAGQVRYTSSNYAGTGYTGTLRYTNITTIAQ